jgi:septum formation protein
VRTYLNKQLSTQDETRLEGVSAVFVEKIEGDYPNILGLPLFKLNVLLNQAGVNIFDYNDKY